MTLRGGQIYACGSLIRSGFARRFDLDLLDSTQISVPPPPLARRLRGALGRMGSLLARLIQGRHDGALIMTSNGFSFLEKGVMVLVARALGVRSALFLRAGYIVQELHESPWRRAFARLVFRSAGVVLCQGAAGPPLLHGLTGVPRDRFAVLKNWIDAGDYCGLAPKRPDGWVDVLFLGWLEEKKGVYELAEAVAALAKDRPNLRLVFAGDGGARSGLKERITALGLNYRTVFLGWVDHERKLQALRDADIVVLPSYYEGMPNALLEGMAAGRAVIGTPVGAVPDLIVNDDVGLLVPPRDIAALASALAELAADPDRRARMGAAARAHLLANHSVEAAEQTLADLLTRRVCRPANPAEHSRNS